MDYYEMFNKKMYNAYCRNIDHKPVDYTVFMSNPYFHMVIDIDDYVNDYVSINIFEDFEMGLYNDKIFMGFYSKYCGVEYDMIYDIIECMKTSELTEEFIGFDKSYFNSYFKIAFRKKRLARINKTIQENILEL